MRDVVILGSTGSIGTQALEVIAARPEQFRVVALTAGGGQLALLADQVRAFAPRFVAVPTAAAAAELSNFFHNLTGMNPPGHSFLGRHSDDTYLAVS